MKQLWFILWVLSGSPLFGQNVYTIKADSVKLTNCDSIELILENHTQEVKGFLYNTGNGRTQFRKGLQKINDSIYIIGADTLKYNAWVQGGNSFGKTGILGTKDNSHLDFYTNGLDRVRLTNTGHLLVGTTTDNGSIFQVNGNGSYIGSLNIGSATITNSGGLLGTNAFLQSGFISQFHNFDEVSLYISQLENVFYNFWNRFDTSSSKDANGVVTINVAIPLAEMSPGASGLVYASGDIYFSFYNGGIPQSVSVQMKNVAGSLFGPYSSSTNLCPDGSFGFFKVSIPNAFNYLVAATITITPTSPGAFLNLQNVEYVINRQEQGLLNPFPFVGKYTNEYLYNPFYFRKNGTDNVRISPSTTLASYFLNNVGLGTTSPTAQLHTTGSVRFAGLTNDSTQTGVLVRDASGNLHYRSAASLAANDIMYSSLAVNGTITAKKLQLSAGNWPDYVFDSAYRVMPLQDLEQYIRQNNHLPGILPVAEAEKNGIDVGKTQTELLKKIEELTLYTIDQGKALHKQSGEMESLRTELTDLKKLIGNKSTK